MRPVSTGALLSLPRRHRVVVPNPVPRGEIALVRDAGTKTSRFFLIAFGAFPSQ